MHKATKFLGYKKGSFPETEKQSREILTLPIHQNLTKKELSKIIVNNKKNIKIINKIVHPEVKLGMRNFFKKYKKKKAIVLDIPLLLEEKINKKKDVLIFVQANKKEIYKRLKKRENFNLNLLNKLKKLQLPLEVKKKKSNFLIKNDFKPLTIKKNIKIIKNKILKRK